MPQGSYGDRTKADVKPESSELVGQRQLPRIKRPATTVYLTPTSGMAWYSHSVKTI